ncbi:MAG: O-antigen ligase family protein, partial [Bacilli bacterium]|nr:O-antigen ligase family protein [Bacilli bacterium]
AFAIIAIPLLVAAIYYAKDRKRLFIDLNIALFLIAVIVYSLFRIEKVAIGVVEYLESMNERGWFADEARMEIYQSGWNTFLVYPIFGAGAYSPPFNLTYEISHYHNFFIQVIATTGLAGLLSFIFFLYSLIKKSMRKQAYATMMILLVIALLIYGLVDHTWFNPIVMILVLIGYSPLSHLRKPV